MKRLHNAYKHTKERNTQIRKTRRLGKNCNRTLETTEVKNNIMRIKREKQNSKQAKLFVDFERQRHNILAISIRYLASGCETRR